MLALHLREPVGPGRTLYGAGGIAWALPVHRRVAAGVELRGARRGAGGAEAGGGRRARALVEALSLVLEGPFETSLRRLRSDVVHQQIPGPPCIGAECPPAPVDEVEAPVSWVPDDP